MALPIEGEMPKGRGGLMKYLIILGDGMADWPYPL